MPWDSPKLEVSAQEIAPFMNASIVMFSQPSASGSYGELGLIDSSLMEANLSSLSARANARKEGASLTLSSNSFNSTAKPLTFELRGAVRRPA